MIELKNHSQGRWRPVSGRPAVLADPVLGTGLAHAGAADIDMAACYAWARERGGPALRALRYPQRAELLDRIARTLQRHRDKYFEISLQNSGTVKNDSAVDVDGALYTLGHYARLGAGLPDAHHLPDGAPEALSRDGAFASQHVLVPSRGVALLINAFNFPAWGLWEKAAPALLSGVPIVVKPATATAWLTHEMVADVIEADILPPGALSIVCGRPEGLLDALEPLDTVSFTGSADTAAALRGHPRIARDGARLNAETDSVNSAILGPDAGEAAIGLLVRETVREMTVKSGQKCTAIRRILVPQAHYDAIGARIAEKLGRIAVGDPRDPGVRMGSLVSRTQRDAVEAGIRQLAQSCDVLFDGARRSAVQAPPDSACVAPVLFGTRDPDGHPDVHRTEVFGPVATLIPYRDAAHALDLARRGMGSLVASVYAEDPGFLAEAAARLAESHGRVHLVSPEVAESHTGHGNAMPQSSHGGPGRAGGGEELGGARALRLYHRLSAIQGWTGALARMAPA
ncbi:Benzaldehyde dehydrogenase [Castellaniella defragrans 65Phen]|uniref:Benzaldehyde dehydrogenase n=1 Tax=Castellaniella defragrans (strain DSM 12143 / CCUG 39792 / 65Phen) TaxID=1437824 RepID=W8X0I3_CASD6|nr:3,4-dehydroadipyl-CoA semialdehyde dehydrogenase [Castellaniella defragrans]CDM25399.1 Benzaldehyde dehydrogenase [Castellaniella defragrans 65Phen]